MKDSGGRDLNAEVRNSCGAANDRAEHRNDIGDECTAAMRMQRHRLQCASRGHVKQHEYFGMDRPRLGFDLYSMLVALVGAVVLLIVLRLFRRRAV
jgi:hypothetical protein